MNFASLYSPLTMNDNQNDMNGIHIANRKAYSWVTGGNEDIWYETWIANGGNGTTVHEVEIPWRFYINLSSCFIEEKPR